VNRLGANGYLSDWDLAEAPRPSYWLALGNLLQAEEVALLELVGAAPRDELAERRRRGRRRSARGA
jgi:hypothetical protein